MWNMNDVLNKLYILNNNNEFLKNIIGEYNILCKCEKNRILNTLEYINKKIKGIKNEVTDREFHNLLNIKKCINCDQKEGHSVKFIEFLKKDDIKLEIEENLSDNSCFAKVLYKNGIFGFFKLPLDSKFYKYMIKLQLIEIIVSYNNLYNLVINQEQIDSLDKYPEEIKADDEQRRYI